MGGDDVSDIMICYDLDNDMTWCIGAYALF